MRYEYTYRNNGFELWQLSMYYTYGSMVGICNIIFTVAVLALAVSRWGEAGLIMRLLLIVGACLFTIIQPAMVYMKAVKQADAIKQDTRVGFGDSGIHVSFGGRDSDMGWDTIKKISKKPTMIVIFTDNTHGFVLTNRVLGTEREAFYEYVDSKVKK